MIFNFQEAGFAHSRCATRSTPFGAGPRWKVFLDHPDDIRRTIPYIEDNPIKLPRPRQTYDFVKPYDGWPLHPGHDPKSPYVRRLRESRYPVD